MTTKPDSHDLLSNERFIYTEANPYNPARSPSWSVADLIQRVSVALARGETQTLYCHCGTAWTAGPHTPATPTVYPFEVIRHGTCKCGAADNVPDRVPHLDAFDAAAQLATCARDTAREARQKAEKSACYELIAEVAELGDAPALAAIAQLQRLAKTLEERLGALVAREWSDTLEQLD